jgi:hypothetical protein
LSARTRLPSAVFTAPASTTCVIDVDPSASFSDALTRVSGFAPHQICSPGSRVFPVFAPAGRRVPIHRRNTKSELFFIQVKRPLHRQSVWG